MAIYFIYFPENQLTKFRAVYTVNASIPLDRGHPQLLFNLEFSTVTNTTGVPSNDSKKTVKTTFSTNINEVSFKMKKKLSKVDADV